MLRSSGRAQNGRFTQSIERQSDREPHAAGGQQEVNHQRKGESQIPEAGSSEGAKAFRFAAG